MAGNNTNCRRLRPPSPNLSLNRSSTSSFSISESLNTSFSSNSSSTSSSRSSSSSSNSEKRLPINRSRSAIRSSAVNWNNLKAIGDIVPARNSDSRSRESSISRDAVVARFLEQGGNLRSYGSSRWVKSSGSSPSAWALSPGRVSIKSTSPSSLCLTQPESPVSTARMMRNNGGGGMTGVLKYFKQKKVSPVQEEDYHRFRVLYNRLLQWRYANAKAEAAMANLKVDAEYQLFWVWLRIYKTRIQVAENLIEVRKIRREIKLHEVLGLQMPMLEEWAKVDAKNCEALSKLTRKLHALSVRLPLVQGAKTDVKSIYEAMVAAIEVMDDVEGIIIKFLPQAEKILYELTELLSILEQAVTSFDEAEKSIALIPSLMASESSLRVHLIQKAME